MRKPDADGLAGAAWRTPLERMEAYAAQHPEKVSPIAVACTLSNWYINGKNWHPFWAWWKVALIDISERTEVRKGLPQARRFYPQAEYNMVILTLDRRYGEPDVDGNGEPPIERVELDYQFHGVTKEMALDVVTNAVLAICSGAMNPTCKSRREILDWSERLSKMVSDFHAGKFGGPKRGPLEIDPVTGRLTGRAAVTA